MSEAIKNLLQFSKGEKVVINDEEKKGKKRKFLETIELQINLKNYDPNKDKRFAGTIRVPYVPRPQMKICVLASEQHAVKCRELNIDTMSEDDIKALNKNKKLIKNLAKKYDAFLASDSIIKKLPRLMGPGLNR